MKAEPLTLVFDFGNTIAPFNSREILGLHNNLAAFVSSRAAVDKTAFVRQWAAAREEDLLRQKASGVENDFRARLARVLAEMGHTPSETFLKAAEDALAVSFVDHAAVDREVGDAIRELAKTIRLGVLSNYLLSEPIHEVLERDLLHDCFQKVLVSKEIGYAKPDRRAFEAIVDALAVPKEQVVYVGDNYSVDMAGAVSFGIRGVWTWAFSEDITEAKKKYLLPPTVKTAETKAGYLAFLRDPHTWLGG